MKLLSLFFAVGSLLTIGLMGTGIAPEVPTPGDCEGVKDALEVFSSYAPQEQDTLAELGQACVTAYPAIYGSSPYDDGDGYSCNAFDDIQEIACVRADASASLVGTQQSACPTAANQWFPNDYCYQIGVSGHGYTGVAGTAGDVTTFASSNDFDANCSWPTSSSGCYTNSPWDYFWYGADYHCEVFTLDVVTTTGNLYGLPNGVASQTARAWCSD